MKNIFRKDIQRSKQEGQIAVKIDYDVYLKMIEYLKTDKAFRNITHYVSYAVNEQLNKTD